MTPSIGYLAPIPVMIQYTASQYIPYPLSDAGMMEPPASVWTALGGAFNGPVLGSFMFGMGIAVARGDQQWVQGGVGVFICVGFLLSLIAPLPGPLLQHLKPRYFTLAIGGILWGVITGIPVFVLGYLLAAPGQHAGEKPDRPQDSSTTSD